MFEETQFRVVPASVEDVGQAAGPALWHGVGLSSTPIGPGALRAIGRGDSYGVAPELTIQLQPGPQGAQVQVRYGASLSQGAVIALVVLVLVFWPVAALLAWLAYKDFTTRRLSTFPMVWHALTPQALPPAGGP